MKKYCIIGPRSHLAKHKTYWETGPSQLFGLLCKNINFAFIEVVLKTPSSSIHSSSQVELKRIQKC